jgi:hypothetical protein
MWRKIWVKKRKRNCMLERSSEMMDKLKKMGVGKKKVVWVGN